MLAICCDARKTSDTIVSSMLEAANFEKIKLIVFDIDGVFTDGRTWQDATGGWKRYFSVRDSMGIRALQKAGYRVAVVTSASAPEIRENVARMAIEDFVDDCDDKSPVIAQLMAKYSLDASQVALMSEEQKDLELMRSLGVALTVPTASNALRREADVVTTKFGGDGAVWEVADMLLKTFALDEREIRRQNGRAQAAG